MVDMTDLAQAQARILELEAEVDRKRGAYIRALAAGERIEAENTALRQDRDRLAGIVHECMATLGMTQSAWEGTDIPRSEDDLPRWVRDVSQASYEKGLALKKADALAEHQMRECEVCGEPCTAYALVRMYQEVRHG